MGEAQLNRADTAGPPGPLRARGLTTNGTIDAVGVDPNDCSFAWTLQARGRQVMQTAYRIVVRRTDPTRGGPVWDSGPVLSARQAFVAFGGSPLAADAAYSGPSNPGAMPNGGGPYRPLAVHHGTAPE